MTSMAVLGCPVNDKGVSEGWINGKGRNGVNWATLIAAAGLGVVLVGAFWSIVQTQFAAQAALIADNRRDIDKSSRLLQEQIDRRLSEVDRRLNLLEAGKRK